MNNLKLQHGLSYSFLTQIVLVLINLITLSCFARLIDPIFFGYFAIYLSMHTLVAPMQDMGLTQAYLKLEKFTDEARNVFFTLNIILSIVVSLLLLLTIPFVIHTYDTQYYTTIVICMIVSILVSSLGIQTRTNLAKDMNFRALFKITFYSGLISSIIAIIVAIYFNSVWPFIIKALINSIVSLFLTYQCEDIKLKLTPIRIVKQYISSIKYSFGIFINRLINGFGQTLDQLVVAKTFGINALAYYSKSVDLSKYPNSLVCTALDTPFFSAISKNESNKENIYNAYFFANFISAGFLSISLMISSEFIVNILLGSKWNEAVVYLQILSILAFAKTINNMTTFILTNEKKMRELFRINIIVIMSLSISCLLLIVKKLEIPVFLYFYSTLYFTLSFFYFLKKTLEFTEDRKIIILMCKYILLILILPLLGVWAFNSNFYLYNDILHLIFIYILGYLIMYVNITLLLKKQFSNLLCVTKDRY